MIENRAHPGLHVGILGAGGIVDARTRVHYRACTAGARAHANIAPVSLICTRMASYLHAPWQRQSGHKASHTAAHHWALTIHHRQAVIGQLQPADTTVVTGQYRAGRHAFSSDIASNTFAIDKLLVRASSRCTQGTVLLSLATTHTCSEAPSTLGPGPVLRTAASRVC